MARGKREDGFDFYAWLIAGLRRRPAATNEDRPDPEVEAAPPGRRGAREGGAERLEFYRGLARERGGVCLSSAYIGPRVSMRWRCAEGHEWDAAPARVRSGTWCLICSARRVRAETRARTLRRVQDLARGRGGRCLSTEYVAGQTHLRWRCAKGHEWEATPSSIVQGKWCNRCAVRGPRPATIQDMRALARSRGGDCLSRSYRGATVPLRWCCAEGHEWSADPKSVRRGSWCRACAPDPRKPLAEVQAMAAALGGVCLSPEIRGVVRLHRFRCQLGHEFDLRPADLQQGQWCSRCRKTPPVADERLRLAAARRGGEVLEVERQGPLVARVRLVCREGHSWWTSPQHLLAGTWCLACFNETRNRHSRRRLSILDMQAVAAARGGECLSQDYVNGQVKLRWRCNAGHEWEATPATIRQRSWCPRCSKGRPGSIDGMRVIAAEHGGRCLSQTYLSHSDRLEFLCARGHRFAALGTAIKSGVWCPTCDPKFAPAAEVAKRELPRRRPATA